MQSRGFLFTFLAALCFGSYGVWSRLMGDVFDPFYQGWTRSIIISVLIIPILVWRGEIKRIEKADRKWVLVFAFSTALTQAPLYYAYNHMEVGAAHLMFYVGMLLTMFAVGFAIYKEEITKIKLMSFASALLGLFVMYSISLANLAIFAALMAILNGVASGTEIAISKKITTNYSALYVTLISWLAILITNLPISYALHERVAVPAFTEAWLYQIIYSLVSLFGFWFAIIGLKYIDSSIGSLIMLLEIVFALTFGTIIFLEPFTVQKFLGASLILLAGGLPYIQNLVANKPRQ